MKLFIAKNVMKTDLALLTPQSGVLLQVRHLPCFVETRKWLTLSSLAALEASQRSWAKPKDLWG